uniref:hypothetical protein n=1 Tax=Loigolactobacillus coryniformis TaxID=1610 RepID=UPI001C657C2F
MKKLPGIGVAKLKGIADQSTVDVFTFTKNIRTESLETLMNTYHLTKMTADTLKKLNETQLLEIEDIRLPDIANIQLLVGEKFKALHHCLRDNNAQRSLISLCLIIK